MANSITIQIPALGSPTGGQTAVAPGGTVKFTNKASAVTHVTFGNKSPFCPQKWGFDIKAGKSKTFDVCSNYAFGGTFTYASTVKGAEAQHATVTVISLQPVDPYVFPEKKPYVFPEVALALALGLVFGVVAGYYLGKRQNPRSTQR